MWFVLPAWMILVCCVVKDWALQDALKMASGWSSVSIISVHSCWPIFCWSVSRSVRPAEWSPCRLVVMIWALLISTASTHTRSSLWDHLTLIYSGPTPTASSVMCSSLMNWPRDWREPASHATVSIQVSDRREFAKCKYFCQKPLINLKHTMLKKNPTIKVLQCFFAETLTMRLVSCHKTQVVCRQIFPFQDQLKKI